MIVNISHRGLLLYSTLQTRQFLPCFTLTWPLFCFTDRATNDRLSVVQEHTEFLAEEAESAKAGEGAAARRAAAAEARAAEAELDTAAVERALRAETRRALGVEGEAANARDAEVAVERLRERMESLRSRLEASETARCVCMCVCARCCVVLCGAAWCGVVLCFFWEVVDVVCGGSGGVVVVVSSSPLS